MIYKLGELFCGPGGLGLGAKLAGATGTTKAHAVGLAWATDYDKDTCETYRKNLSTEDKRRVVCKDIRKLDFRVLDKISPVDALAFGFPCNDFSVVGEQKGTDGVFGPLYKYCALALAHFRPTWFLAENVGGLRNSNDGNALEAIMLAFIHKGYRLYPNLYKFEQYGVPQTRHRILIVGIRDDIDIKYQVPSPSRFTEADISSRKALTDPPIAVDAPNHDFTKQSPVVIERLKYIKPGENAFTANVPQNLQLNITGARISQIYKRLHPDKPSYTVTGSGGGGTHVYHWKENRALTNRERARLQTFPDDFIFCGSKESVRKQIGMAVPPLGAKVVFEAILKSLAGVPYEYVEANMSVPVDKALLV